MVRKNVNLHGFAANTYFLFVLQEMIVPNNVIDLPPPSPPKPKTIVLPPNWKVARDPEGKIYYYHIVTRLVLLCLREVFVPLKTSCMYSHFI